MDLSEVRRLPLVVVHWKDITSHHGGSWFDLEHFGPASDVYTPGWIIQEDDDNLYMASTLCVSSDHVGGGFDTTIPKGCVVWVETRGNKQWWLCRAPKNRTETS